MRLFPKHTEIATITIHYQFELLAEIGQV